jgi:hypothetical protein
MARSFQGANVGAGSPDLSDTQTAAYPQDEAAKEYLGAERESFYCSKIMTAKYAGFKIYLAVESCCSAALRSI